MHGFGLRSGALASSVGHDCHNLCVVGADDADMAMAANRLVALGGGFVAVRGGTVLGGDGATGCRADEPAFIRGCGARLGTPAGGGAGDGLPAGEPFLQLAFLDSR